GEDARHRARRGRTRPTAGARARHGRALCRPAAEGAAPDQAPDEDGAAHGAQGLPRPVRRLPGHVPQRARAPRGGQPPARALLNPGQPMNGHAPHFEVEDFADPAAALARVHEIYDLAVDHLRRGLQHYVDGADIGRHVRACYPLLRVRTDTVARPDSRLSYGFVAGPGVFETPLTRPDLFADSDRKSGVRGSRGA